MSSYVKRSKRYRRSRKLLVELMNQARQEKRQRLNEQSGTREEEGGRCTVCYPESGMREEEGGRCSVSYPWSGMREEEGFRCAVSYPESGMREEESFRCAVSYPESGMREEEGGRCAVSYPESGMREEEGCRCAVSYPESGMREEEGGRCAVSYPESGMREEGCRCAISDAELLLRYVMRHQYRYVAVFSCVAVLQFFTALLTLLNCRKEPSRRRQVFADHSYCKAEMLYREAAVVPSSRGTQCNRACTVSVSGGLILPSCAPASRLCGKTRHLIARVHENLKLQNPENYNVSFTARLLGVARATVTDCAVRCAAVSGYQAEQIRSGHSSPGSYKLPPCRETKRQLLRREMCKQVRERTPIFVQQKLREVMHSFYRQKTPPTLASVLNIMRASLGGDFDYGREHLRQLLRGIGFKFQIIGTRAICFERGDICRWRRLYVRRVEQLRREGYTFFYSDETWLFEGMQLSRQWVDTVTARNPVQSLREGLTAGPYRAPKEGKRVVIVHTMGENGFVEGAEKFIVSGKTVADGDYHGEMNAATFEDYLRTTLPLLRGSDADKIAFVVDNAPYHNRRIEKIPTKGSTKAAMQAFLERHGIQYDVSWGKARLLSRVSESVRGNERSFEVKASDAISREFGVLLIRLPPYHCELNPIEQAWSWVKHRIAAEAGLNCKLNDIIKLAQRAFHEMPAENARAFFRNLQKLEEHYRVVDAEDRRTTAIEFDREELDDSDESSFSDGDSSLDEYATVGDFSVET